jgi:hypothetical protein
MNDLLVILMTLGFFGICVAYVGLCDRIVGPDEPESEAEPVVAGATGSPATEAAR